MEGNFVPLQVFFVKSAVEFREDSLLGLIR